jgi:uncharacterized SAM-binding protein YcdF (DUF218 family)
VSSKINTYQNKIDLIIVLGLQLDSNWQLRQDIKNRLDKVIEYHKQNPKVKILVSGRYSISFDWMGIKPKALECVLMKDYLVREGVPKKLITMESKAKDTIGNAYYTKQYVKKWSRYKSILIVCSTQHKKRVELLFSKFYGPNYDIHYLTFKAQKFTCDELTENKEIQDLQQLLSNVRHGCDEDFKNQLYKNRFYSRSRLVNNQAN